VPIRDELVARTIAQLRMALEAVSAQREHPVPDVRAEVERLYLAHLGSAAGLVRRLGSDDLLDVLRSAGHVDAERAYLLGALLEVDAAALAREADAATAALAPALRGRALDLMLEAAFVGVGEADVDERVARLREQVPRGERSDATWQRLHAYDRQRGDFARAEDTLFAWLDQHPGDRVARAGEAFYDHLAALGDEALDAGGLPRDEVDEGRAAFSAAFSAAYDS
jgi:hypothetical protein